MTDLLFQMALSNACFALALAIVATVVAAKARRPQLTYMLWLLVFIKLLTPPVLTIPLDAFSLSLDDMVLAGEDLGVDEQSASAETASAASLSSRLAALAHQAKPWLVATWLAGSLLVLAGSVVRVLRFNHLLLAESEAAPEPLQTAAAKLARRLGLDRLPAIVTTSANLSPMVWWMGGPVRVVLPAMVLDQTDARQAQWILAHELAHVRRRDHLVRWLEWLTCILSWWNPVVWWAQRNLRAAEEICCDDLVLSCLNPEPKSYANSLLAAVEFLARPVLRPPAVASEINSGGLLERRFRMIVADKTNRPNPRWLRACVLLGALIVLPFGLASAQDYVAVAQRLKDSVANGEITAQQADTMMAALDTETSHAKAGAKMAVLKKQAAASKSDPKMEDTWKKLQAMVKAGKLTEKQAKAKMAVLKERAAAGKSDAKLEATWKELQAMVEAGELTKVQAKAKMDALKKQVAAKADLNQAEKKLAAAVKAGKITKEQAAAKVDLEQAKKKLIAAVEAGKITKEQAREKLAAYERDQGKVRRAGDDTSGLIIRALMGNGMAGKQVQGAVGALRQTVGEIQREGEAFQFDPDVRKRLAGMGLTSEQIDFVVGLARRLAHDPTG
jgi:beta-lactamase regulating signal transducer with metallopeptidase domain